MANTRICITANGEIHLGHVYCALVNQAEAKATGGCFTVRFDDSQRIWKYITGEAMYQYKKQVITDLLWLGIQPDHWSSQEALMWKTESLASQHLFTALADQPFASFEASRVAGDKTSYYPFCERFTQEHVLMDFIEECALIIRGNDLLTEDCLYRYFVDKYTLPRVELLYLARLQFEGSEIVSKTAGNFKICDFREAGVDPAELIAHLAVDCLVDPAAGWRFANVKARPVLGGWAKEMIGGKE